MSATLEASAATGAEVELSYHVSSASWRPLYDLAFDGERLAVTYLAEITQQTGEDWPAVELVLSTTRRGLHQTLPELPPPVYGARPRPDPSANGGGQINGVHRSSSSKRTQSYGLPYRPVAGAPEADLEEAALLAAEPGESGVGLVYRVPRPLAVPADGGPHKTTVAWFELDAILDHLTVPVLAPEAYLRATVTNRLAAAAAPLARHRVFRDRRLGVEGVPGDASPLARNSSSSSVWTTRSGSNAELRRRQHQQGRDRGHPHDRHRL